MLLHGGLEPLSIVRRMLQLLSNTVGPSRWLAPGGVQQVGKAFTDEFVTEDLHTIVSSRVCLSITQLRPFKNQRITTFANRQDLCDALRAACFIPSLTAPAMRFRDRWCIDGGFTDNEPILDTSTLRVSPLWTSVRGDIRPRVTKVGLNEMLRVPSTIRAWSLFDRGLRDARSYLSNSAIANQRFASAIQAST